MTNLTRLAAPSSSDVEATGPAPKVHAEGTIVGVYVNPSSALGRKQVDYGIEYTVGGAQEFTNVIEMIYPDGHPTLQVGDTVEVTVTLKARDANPTS